MLTRTLCYPSGEEKLRRGNRLQGWASLRQPEPCGRATDTCPRTPTTIWEKATKMIEKCEIVLLPIPSSSVPKYGVRHVSVTNPVALSPPPPPLDPNDNLTPVCHCTTPADPQPWPHTAQLWVPVGATIRRPHKGPGRIHSAAFLHPPPYATPQHAPHIRTCLGSSTRARFRDRGRVPTAPCPVWKGGGPGDASTKPLPPAGP